jgi:cell division septal protein FtsQ
METIKVIFKEGVIEEVSADLKRLLNKHDVSVQVKPETVGFDGFSLDPASLIVSGASVLSTLISALLAYLANKKSGSITVSGSSGREINIPKDTPIEKIKEYIKLAKELDSDQILVSL